MKIITLLSVLTLLSICSAEVQFNFHNATDEAIILTKLDITNTTADKFNGTYVVTTHASIASITNTAQNQVLCLSTGSSNYSLSTNANITDGFMLSLTCSGGSDCTGASNVAFAITDIVNVTYVSDTQLTINTIGSVVTSTSTVTTSAGSHTASFSIAQSVTTDFPTGGTKYLSCWPNFNTAQSTTDLSTTGSKTSLSGRTNHTMSKAFGGLTGIGAMIVILSFVILC
mmetsp:Transcript_7985/g.7067  ORF Transcript_7985/g.7067 Transcript_7985/m.7067 type:complete len:228 (-) Transcript_7985:34-717(-)